MRRMTRLPGLPCPECGGGLIRYILHPIGDGIRRMVCLTCEKWSPPAFSNGRAIFEWGLAGAEECPQDVLEECGQATECDDGDNDEDEEV